MTNKRMYETLKTIEPGTKEYRDQFALAHLENIMERAATMYITGEISFRGYLKVMGKVEKKRMKIWERLTEFAGVAQSEQLRIRRNYKGVTIQLVIEDEDD